MNCKRECFAQLPSTTTRRDGEKGAYGKAGIRNSEPEPETEPEPEPEPKK